MMNIFTSSRAPNKSNSLRITNSTFQPNIYRIPTANSKPLNLNRNYDPLRESAPIRPVDRFAIKLDPVSDKNKAYLKKKPTQEDLSIEKELEDIEEHDGNKENYSINRIPVSPIGFKQMPNSLTRLSSSVDRRYDSCHLSTEPSIGSTSLHATPNQDPKRMSYFGDHLDVITNELKAPSMISDSYKQRLSVNSMSEFEGKETPRRSLKIFGSGSKQGNNIFATQMSLPNHETQSNSNFQGPIRPTALSGVNFENKRVSQSTEFSHLIKHTPPKKNITVSTEKSHGTPIETGIGSATKNKSFTEHNANGDSLRQSYHKQSRSSYTSEGLKKCLNSLNKLDGKLDKFDAKTWIKQVLTTNPRKKLRCSCDTNLSATDESCSRALGWLYKRFNPEEFGYLKNTYEKIVAEQNLLEPEQTKQIQKDIYRTYPSCKLFEPESEGAMTLERLLNAFAKYDPVVGYVQGMNFIAGSLLYHAEEYLAFWILVTIFETLEMRDIYLPRLPGLSKHCQIIDMLIFNVLPDVYTKLCEFSIKPEIFCSEWILTLFGSVVPIEDMGIIYDNLLNDGWPFFYKLILAFLLHFGKEIQEQTDVIEVLTILKSQNHLPKDIRKTKKSPYYIDWKVLCQKAQEITIDSDFIYDMHMKFDSDNLWFRTTD